MPWGPCWNYADALGFALSLSDPVVESRFTADPARWNEAIFELKRDYQERLPQVFGRMFFDERQGRTPYSAEIDHFLHSLAQAQLMSEPNPAYEILQLTVEQKQTLARLNENRLRDFRPLLEEIGRKLSEALAAGD